jgi:hypothetical protein
MNNFIVKCWTVFAMALEHLASRDWIYTRWSIRVINLSPIYSHLTLNLDGKHWSETGADTASLAFLVSFSRPLDKWELSLWCKNKQPFTHTWVCQILWSSCLIVLYIHDVRHLGNLTYESFIRRPQEHTIHFSLLPKQYISAARLV